MRILVACEESGTIREAFKVRGHDAWSCDLKPSKIAGQHIQGDVFSIFNKNWDLIILHPPCGKIDQIINHYKIEKGVRNFAAGSQYS